MLPDALRQLLFVITPQQRDSRLLQYFLQQQVPALAFRCLMGTVVKLHRCHDTPVTVRDNHIAVPL